MNLDQVSQRWYRLAQGPLLLEEDDRRLRLPTTRKDTVLNPWIHIPLCVIALLSLFSLVLSHFYVLLKENYFYCQDEDYLLRHKGIIDTRRILIWRKVLRSRVCHGSTNFSLYCLTLFITCLLLLLPGKILINSKDPEESGITSSLSLVKSMTSHGCGVSLLLAKSIGSLIGINLPSCTTNIWTWSGQH